MKEKLRTYFCFFGFICFCLIFLNWSPCKGQYTPWKSFSTAHGLGDVEVYTIYEATFDTTLWFGTRSGVTRYDGGWTNFEIEDTTPSGKKVRAIIEYDSDNIWLGTERGLKNLHKNKIKKSSIALFDSLSDKSIWVMKRDNRRKIWIGTSNGVYYFNQHDSTWVHHYMLDNSLENKDVYSVEVIDSLAWFGTGPFKGIIYCLNLNNNKWEDSTRITGANQITDLFKDNNNKLWATTLGSQAHYLEKNEWKLFDTELRANVYAMTQDWDGDFWFATETNGVMQFDSTELVEVFNMKNGLPHYHVNDILEDSYRNIWIAFQYTGVSRYNGTWRAFLRDPLQKIRQEYEIRGIEKDDSSNIWFGQYGNGIHKYDGKKIEVISPNEKINAIEKSSDSKLWFGTWGEGIKIFDSMGLRPYPCPLDGKIVLSIFEDFNNHLWFGTQDSGVYRYNRENSIWTQYTVDIGLVDNNVNAIFEDHEKRLWFATDSGISCYDDEKGMYQFMYASHRITSIAEDKNGTIWFGTGGEKEGIGVITYNPSKDIEIDTISTDQGLASNQVYSILFNPNNNRLWFGTNRGVNCLIPGDNKDTGENKDIWIFYNKQTTGLPDNLVYSIFLDLKIEIKKDIADTTSILWFGTYDGAVRYLGDAFPPETYILTDKNLTFNTDRPIFEVSGRDNISARYEISYSYKIQQINDSDNTVVDWTDFSFDNRIITPPLNNGDYKIFVRARDGDGNIDPTPAIMEFNVEQLLINPFGREITSSFENKSIRIYVSPKAFDNEIRIKVYELEADTFFSKYDIVAIHAQIQKFEPLHFKKAGIISIKDLAIIPDAEKKKHLTIYHLPASKVTSWYPIGGTVNFDDSTITAPFKSFGKYAVGLAEIPQDDYVIKDFDCQPRVFSTTGSGPARHTNILFTLGEISNVSIKIYNVAGRLIRNLTAQQSLYPGENAITWDGTDEKGFKCVSGLYIICTYVGSLKKIKPVVIVNN